MALIVASTVERLIAAYKNVLEIRLAHQKLKESGASDKALKAVAEDAEAKMDQGIKALVNELLKQAQPEIEQRPEERAAEGADRLVERTGQPDRPRLQRRGQSWGDRAAS